MPTYKVTDPSSGKVVSFTGNTPPDEGTIKQAFSQIGQSNKPGVLEDPLNKSGLYNIPILGGILGRGIAEPLAKGAEMIGEGARSLVNPNQPNPSFMNSQDYQNLTHGDEMNALKSSAGQGLSTGMAATGALEAPAIAKGAFNAVTNIPSALGFLTKAGVGKKIGNKVAQATANGATDTWNDFTNEVRQAVTSKLGKDQPYQDIVNSRLSAETPASISENPTITPKDLQGFRQQAANREPTGIFAKFQGKSPQNQVDEIIRQVSSSRLKDLAGTGKLDKLYSLYSKIGSPAEIGAKGAGALAVSQLVPKENQGQAFTGLSGAAELLKILGIL